MKIVTAESAGFCFGVRKAVDIVYREAGGPGPVYTYGPIIHNQAVVEDLEKKGVRVLRSEEELAEVKGGVIVTRSHGVSRAEEERLRRTGARVVDATCPFVKRIHRTVEKESAQGSEIVIIGNPDHPEVKGIMGWSHTPVTVISNEEEARSYIPRGDGQICVVAQTTFNANKFKDFIAILQQRGYNILCVNTICSATHERQAEAREIARIADTMIVIGDSSSSNSAKLYEICRKECPDTQFIQSWRDLQLPPAGGDGVVGITAGASVPSTIIEEVQLHVRAEF